MFWWIVSIVVILYFVNRVLKVIQENSPESKIDRMEADVIGRYPKVIEKEEERIKHLTDRLNNKNKRILNESEKDIEEEIVEVGNQIKVYKEIKDKYIQLKEKYAHKPQKLLELCHDHFNYFYNQDRLNKIVEQLNYVYDADYLYEEAKEIHIKNAEIIKRFDRLLKD